ncbi:MAG: MoaD/ThiS family protein [Thermoplasmata archaeon]|uniref:MoaD/ThiS family protein n=1 Tax=Candidatus Sysuiplasma superficiale TaxID=2823368 RepID=A0A8J7YZ27_9ARCH|nr:MoaD/ThiS family protein [Candidatus Sysuiplasma superficiale]
MIRTEIIVAAVKIEILLFAHFREIAGCPSINVEMPDEESWTIRELGRRIAEQYPVFSKHISSCLFAVNEEFARRDTRFGRMDRVAMLPQVSGGN